MLADELVAIAHTPLWPPKSMSPPNVAFIRYSGRAAYPTIYCQPWREWLLPPIKRFSQMPQQMSFGSI